MPKSPFRVGEIFWERKEEENIGFHRTNVLKFAFLNLKFANLFTPTLKMQRNLFTSHTPLSGIQRTSLKGANLFTSHTPLASVQRLPLRVGRKFVYT